MKFKIDGPVFFLTIFTLGVVGAFVRSHAESAEVSPRRTAPPHDRLVYPSGAPQLSMLEIVTVESQPLPSTEPLAARLAYDEDHTAHLLPSIAGRIVSITVAPGDSVKRGQTLAVLDSPDFGTVRADFEKALADEARKRLARDRAADLAADQSVAARDVENAIADFQTAHAETERARARLQNLESVFHAEGRTVRVVSPIDGVVTERNASVATEVTPGQGPPLFVISNLKYLWAYIDVPDRHLPLAVAGQPVLIESDSTKAKPVSAVLRATPQIVDPNTRRASVRADLVDSTRVLMPEMFVRARILAAHGNTAIRVPASAFVTRGVSTFVYVEVAPHEYVRRSVHLARRDAADGYVDRGLAAGDRVVTTGALLLDAEFPEPSGA